MVVAWRKGIVRGMLALVMSISVVGIFAAPQRVYAVPSEVIVDAPRFAEWSLSALKTIGENALLASIFTALVNTVTFGVDRLAYDAAVFIASGGDGEDPLFENRTAMEYLRDYGASVAGAAIDAIDNEGILGNFKLCNPDFSVTLAFKFGIQGAFDRPEPECNISEIRDNWAGFLADIETTLASPTEKNSMILTQLADMYNPKENDFSVGILLYTDVLTKAQQDAVLATQRELFGGFFKDKTDFITGRVETPAEVLQDRFTVALNATDETRRQIAIASMGDSKVLMQIGIHAGSVFTNTLLSKFTEKIYNGLFGDLDQTDINPFDSESYSLGTTEDARETYRSFLTAPILSVQDYSLLDDFGACPYEGKSLYNCVADSSFISAISRADGGTGLTIKEALDEGLLNSAWPLIPSSDSARDQDQYCYSYGYCHGNLVKLRKARVISVGWEFAAESSDPSSPITLGEVVDGFYQCNAQNELDENNPWCHLIDPNWVLKYPETQCKNEAYGQLLESSVSDQRKTECVDMPSCIDQDGEGNCTGGYGYCVREENVWNFRGEECPEYYGSCTTYQNPDGEQENFLSNTTNSSGCTEDSAGCLWHNTKKIDEGSGVFDWPDYSVAADLVSAEAADDIYNNRIYFTSAVEECSSEDGGCRELASRTNGLALNMVANPSFENDEDANGIPDRWFLYGSGTAYSISGDAMLDGTDAVGTGSEGGFYYQEGIVLTQGAEYTMSFYAAQNSGVAATNVQLAMTSSSGELVDFRGFGLSGDCAVALDSSVIEIIATPAETIYERLSCTFTVPTLSESSAEVNVTIAVKGGDLWFDSLQLEQESAASTYHEGYSESTLDLAYVKVPPIYLGCTGGADDSADCDKYAKVCSEVDVGCSLYTPTNGDPSVSGIVGSLDECPESCVGYDTFKQEETRYEPDGEFPVYFIPDSAESCTAQYVGCDEFTNIATEEPSYFTYVRACVTQDQAAANIASDNAAIFYTWEGSDTSGYQLKTWNLLESNMGPDPYTYASDIGMDTDPNLAPCTSWSTSDEGISCHDDSSGVLDEDTDSCDEHDDTITNPDCREFYDTEGNIHYREWTKTVTVNDACVTYRKTDIVGADVATQEANCEESGGYFNSITAECRYYGYADESDLCSEAEAGCREYTGGRSNNSRQAFEEYFEEGSLSNWDADSATTVTLSNESIATDGHSLLSDGESVWTYIGGDGTVCASEDGCTTTADGVLGGTCALLNGESYCGTLSQELFAGKTYVLSFWAKGSGSVSVGFDTSRTSGTATIDSSFIPDSGVITLDTNWQQYSYGPIYMDPNDYPDFGDGASVLAFVPVSGSTFYIDNVILREGEDNITVIKNSWVTPAECDSTEGGTSSPQYMLGCQEYTDQNSETAYVKSFSSLCDESKIGCSAYFMTQESDAIHASVYGAYCSRDIGRYSVVGAVTEPTPCYFGQNADRDGFDTTSEYLCTIGVGDEECEFNLDWYVPVGDLPSHLSYQASTVISPADKDVFLVVDDSVECSSDVAGCMEVGLPVFSQDHTAVASWTTTYLMNTPDNYADSLCSQDELFCEAWVDNNGSTSYFKDPQDQTCEYRTDVTIDYVTYQGWFKTGTEDPCDPDYIIGGDTAGIWRNGDDSYANWVGTCFASYDTCSEFQDVSDLTTDELYSLADGTSYYYLNNDSLEENSLPDSQKCNGEVSQTDGCGIFNNTSIPAKTSNASATYIASVHADALFGARQNDFVDPIDCDGTSTITTPSGTTVDLCANRCWYSAAEYYDINGSTDSYVYDGSCYENSDCRPLASETGAEVNGFCASSYGDYGSAPRLENDSNSVLKVNRDRECSEWLSCSDAQTTWDPRTNSYITVCGGVDLCTQYSGTSDASFCSEWKDNGAAVVLDQSTYSSRDVSWYGDDYSGYAIPGLLPVDQLTQINIANPSTTCDTEGSGSSYLTTFDGDQCTDDADCGGSEGGSTYCKAPKSEYRLGYVAGSCEVDYGESCSVGYCENTGSPCISTSACGVDGGSCLIGTCYARSTTVCASSADCSSGQTCLGTVCATDGGDAAIDSYNPSSPNAVCGSGQILYPSVNFKAGTCMYDQCVLTPNGSVFEINDSEASVCRAYPEINSPFGNEIVTAWQDPSDSSPLTIDDANSWNADTVADALPVSFVQNFENVQSCALGEDCSCTYKKITYGDGGTIRYFSEDTSVNISNTQGICSGGSLDGSFCADTSSCGDSGTCEKPTQIDDVLGLEGYCLERDSSTNILGDRDLNACLSWLPIDQLSGSTDLYAKYTEAGYFEETNYCSWLGEYASVTTSWGCLETDGTETVNKYECMNENTACPVGFVMVAGPDKGADSGGETTSLNDACSDDGDNDCPFMCIPLNSKDAIGDDCTTTVLERFYDETLDRNFPSGYPLYGYWISTATEYEAAFDALRNCTTDGVEYNEYLSNTYAGVEFWSTSWGWMMKEQDESSCGAASGTCGWYDYNGLDHYSPYLGCKEMTQVSDGDGESGATAWTDRIYNPNNTDSLMSLGLIQSSYPSFGYVKETSNEPFGATQMVGEILGDGDAAPSYINQCRLHSSDDDSVTWTFYNASGTPNATNDGMVCASIEGSEVGAGLNASEAATYISFDGYYNYANTSATDYDSDSRSSSFVNVGSGGGPSTILDHIFARSLKVITFADGIFGEDGLPSASPGDGTVNMDPTTVSSATWDSRAIYGVPPSVWAVNTDRCYNDYCEEDAAHSLTVNDQNEGDIESSMFYRAYLKFFAAAYKEQLPIRRVMVDWGDGSDVSGSSSENNFYKNHRGLESGQETSICEKPTSDSDYEWGMSSESCDPNYFSFNHIYTCNPSRMTGGTCDDGGEDGIIDNAPCTLDGNQCVFRPSVHVRDNWGWCTGTCTTGNAIDEDSSGGCFAGTDYGLSDIGEPRSECAYSYYPDGNSALGVDPWVYYDGTIIVTP
ncbi:MAG: hypothetical protein WCT28_01390 [Patescibacteria group bacterium]|jgi:hypothetical protein